jgi:CSLREA domain-containing protein
MDSRVMRQFFGAAIGVALAGLAFVLPAPTAARSAPAALDIHVNSPSDILDFAPGDGVCETAHNGGACTLRAAIQEADAHAGADTITLEPGVTYLLALPGNENKALNGDLDITDTVTILGAGPNSTIIDGNGGATGDRVFQITGTVVISGVTIMHGQSAGDGGGIENMGQLTLITA